MERNEAEKAERRAWKRLEGLAAKVADAAKPVWRFGDGQGGEVQRKLNEAFASVGLEIHRSRRVP